MTMATNNELIAHVVQKVMEELMQKKDRGTDEFTGIYDTVDEAVNNAVEAHKRLLILSLESRSEIIASIRKAILDHNEILSELAIKETQIGRYEDKIRENILCATKTPGVEDIKPEVVSGDHGLTLLEYAPVGVIGALTPITNPTGTFINNSISMISAGNAVVFNPHPSARQTSLKTIQIIHQAIVDAGGPVSLVSCVREPTLETAEQIIKHPKIDILVATGGKPVVKAVLSSGKKAIGAGAGNPPALVDETAHIRKAADAIVNGASINNNVFCTCEKEVIVVDEVADALIKFMQETGKAYLLTPEEAEKVTQLVVTPESHINPKYIGKNVQVILSEVGINLTEEYRLAIFEASKDHPLFWLEQMMPIMPVVRVENVTRRLCTPRMLTI
jgi:propionaldehyde dehydrogenase